MVTQNMSGTNPYPNIQRNRLPFLETQIQFRLVRNALRLFLAEFCALFYVPERKPPVLIKKEKEVVSYLK